MGYIQHDAVIAVVSDYDDETIARIEEFRASMDADLSLSDQLVYQSYAKFLVGPVIGVNGYHMYCFLPDGSKEGWAPSDKAQKLREQFQEIAKGKQYDDGSAAGDVVAIRFGGDFGAEEGTQIVATTDHRYVPDRAEGHNGKGMYQTWDGATQSWQDDAPLTKAAIGS